MITQFAILVGDDMPDYSNDALLCTYIVGYVFICTLALLNFLLAIIVNGYTKVSEAALEIKVAFSLPVDVLIVCIDVFKWAKHRSWPSKRIFLDILAAEYDLRKGNVAGKAGLTLDDFIVMLRNSVSGLPKQEAELLFRHYCRWECLVFKEDDNGTPLMP
jgi:hypothetical protein